MFPRCVKRALRFQSSPEHSPLSTLAYDRSRCTSIRIKRTREIRCSMYLPLPSVLPVQGSSSRSEPLLPSFASRLLASQLGARSTLGLADGSDPVGSPCHLALNLVRRGSVAHTNNVQSQVHPLPLAVNTAGRIVGMEEGFGFTRPESNVVGDHTWPLYPYAGRITPRMQGAPPWRVGD